MTGAVQPSQGPDRQGFHDYGRELRRGVDIQGTVWWPITGPETIGVIKAVWLDSNPKRAVLRLPGMARNMAAGPEPNIGWRQTTSR